MAALAQTLGQVLLDINGVVQIPGVRRAKARCPECLSAVQTEAYVGSSQALAFRVQQRGAKQVSRGIPAAPFGSSKAKGSFAVSTLKISVKLTQFRFSSFNQDSPSALKQVTRSPTRPPSTDWGPSPWLLLFVFNVVTSFDGLSHDLEVFHKEPWRLFVDAVNLWVVYYQLGVDAKNGHFQPRDSGLSPDWHNLYDPTEELSFYYNSVTKVSQWTFPEQDPVVPGTQADASHTSSDLVTSYLVTGASKALTSLFKIPLPQGLTAG